jgi:hypothetical protein
VIVRLKTHVLRFMATKGFVSGAIKFVEGVSYIDHVEALNRAGDGWIGAHAGGGVQSLPLDWTKPEDIVWERQYSIPLTDEEYELVMGLLESKIGTKYDYSGCLGLFFHLRGLDDSSRKDCSALQYEALWTGGKLMLNVLPEFSHLVTPETLHLSPLLMKHCSYSYPAKLTTATT